ncbi:Aristolochene synthase [Metarhizium brunneum]|uniref:Terpene synthase n=1 Tax=Metarhizium brunneum TaxID=500148 RepID=A0A7D5YUF2_9HYPO
MFGPLSHQPEPKLFEKRTDGNDFQCPPSILSTACHSLVEEMTERVNDFFLTNWPFPDEARRRAFVAGQYARVACLAFPMANNDRIYLICVLLTIQFLIDDAFGDLSFSQGRALAEHIAHLCRGQRLPNRAVPMEWISYNLFRDMRELDAERASHVADAVEKSMMVQTSTRRGKDMGFSQFVEYRSVDVGTLILFALVPFSMGLEPKLGEREEVRDVNANFARHFLGMNDLVGYEREVMESKAGHEEGGTLINSVSVLAAELCLSPEATKRLLWQMCREWERRHRELARDVLRGGDSPDLETYVKCLEYMMTAGEVWRLATARYQVS